MPVICAACHTENREHAMFCRGCAGKLPAFAATGPSVLEVMKAQHDAEAPGTTDAGDLDPVWRGSGSASRSILPGAILSPEMRSFWLRLGLLMLVVMLAFVGWSSYVTRKVPLRGGGGPDIGVPFDSAAAGVPPRSAVTTVVVLPPASSTAAAAASMPSTLPLPPTDAATASAGTVGTASTGSAAASPASDTAATPSTTASGFPTDSANSLANSQSNSQSNSHAIAAAVAAAAAAPPLVAAPARVAAATPPAPIALSASLAPGESALPSGAAAAGSRRPPPYSRHEARSAPPVRVAGADPRQGCGGLNFIFAAHCEAVHCEEAAFSANPRCDAVRAQRERDLARRNLEF
jgi:hypothetical protein